jgi:2-polyprenyl-6-methoxyphenol hydroxylase-like FAD-dependent oxidoreductase
MTGHAVVVAGGGPTGLMLAGELAVPIYRGREVTGFTQDDTGVDVELSDGQSLRAEYLTGCDGGRSLIRKTAGIEFPGWDPSVSSLVAEVELSEEPQWGIRYDDKGAQALGKLGDGKRARVVVSERPAGHTGEPALRDLSRALIDVWGTDYGVHSPAWISRFTDMTRQAASYRNGRVLLAGDAAHVHYPVGGQGLQIGPHARPVPGHRRRPAAGIHPAARCPAGAAQPRSARQLRHHPLGGPGPAGRRHLRRHMGASGPRRGPRSRGRADPARRICGLGGRPHPPGTP